MGVRSVPSFALNVREVSDGAKSSYVDSVGPRQLCSLFGCIYNPLDATIVYTFSRWGVYVRKERNATIIIIHTYTFILCRFAYPPAASD